MLTALCSVGFSEGKHLWKVRMLMAGNSAEAGIGTSVARSTEESPLRAEAPQLSIRMVVDYGSSGFPISPTVQEFHNKAVSLFWEQ